jgi:multidrug efflux pump subunit AcrA (membrane-fusion protein)
MHQQATKLGLKKRRWLRWTLLGIVVVAIAVWVLFQKSEKSIEVTTEKAAIRDITQVVAATGKIRPRIEVKISPEVSGEIIELPVVNGQRVKKGDLLLKIRPDPYIAAVQQARASVNQAEAACLQAKAQMLNDQLDLHRSQDLHQLQADRKKEQEGVEFGQENQQDKKKMERVVFVRSGDMVKMVKVRTGIADNDDIQIISGLRPGDNVVTGPYTAISQKLKDGARVVMEKGELNEP